MNPFHTKVRLSGFTFEDSQLTTKISGTVTQADIGKAVSIDTATANTVKLAADGDDIIGRLHTLEARTNEGVTLATIEFRFAAKLPIQASLTGNAVPAIGKRLCGAGGGFVKAIDFSTPTAALAASYAVAPICWEVIGTDAVATKIV